jgi:starch synthase
MGIERVVMVTPEYYGRVMVGGLAPAVHGLAHGLKDKGIDVRVMHPVYAGDTSKKFTNVVADQAKVSDDDGVALFQIQNSNLSPVTYSSLGPDINNLVYHSEMDKLVYEHALKFADKVNQSLTNMAASHWQPDLIHIHDWFPAYSAVLIKENGLLRDVSVLLTSHNLSYIGELPYEKTRVVKSNLDADMLMSKSHRIGILSKGQLCSSVLEAGMLAADAISTVSAHYALEIESGKTYITESLARRIREKGILHGIPNGLDSKIFDPENDPYIPVKYTPEDMESVEFGKAQNKAKLFNEVGLVPYGARLPMLVSVMSRLTAQKGIVDIINAVNLIPADSGIAFFITGETEDSSLREALASLKENKRAHPYFANPDLQHLVLAASDAILMPSKWEPFGYTNLEGLRYGAFGITTEVGGLKDTMIPYDGSAGYNFPVRSVCANDIVAALLDAKKAFDQVGHRTQLRANSLAADFSWDRPNGPIDQYLELYTRLASSKTKTK